MEEFENKYKVDYLIKAKDLSGERLKGEYILEIPASNLDTENLDYYIQLAKEYNVTIRFREEYPEAKGK